MSEVPLYGRMTTAEHLFDDWYRGTSLIRNDPRRGPYSRTIPTGVLWWSQGAGLFLMSEVSL